MHKKFILSSLILILAGFSLTSTGAAQTGDIAVVVNSRNAINDLSLSELRKIFSGQKRSWGNGASVKLIVRAPGSAERGALLHLIGMSEGDYKKYWTAQIVRGEADSEPLVIPSFGMVKEAAKVYPGAICFVDPQDIKPGMDLKLLKIDGHSPGDTGYPLR